MVENKDTLYHLHLLHDYCNIQKTVTALLPDDVRWNKIRKTSQSVFRILVIIFVEMLGA